MDWLTPLMSVGAILMLWGLHTYLTKRQGKKEATVGSDSHLDIEEED